MELTLTYFKTGVSWWQTRTKWPRDFHNAVYHELYDLRRNGLSGLWWEKTVDRLAVWQATRPFTKLEISQRGFRSLAELRRLYIDVCSHSESEPAFSTTSWDQVGALYHLLSMIKKSHTPVFPSKLGHFIFPRLFIIVDHKATGTTDYEDLWRETQAAWIVFYGQEEAKNILTKEIAKHSVRQVHTHYPFETKIIELCNIGRKHAGTQNAISDKIRQPASFLADEGSPKNKNYAMVGVDETYSCERCRLSIRRLKEMAEKGGTKEMFKTFAGTKEMNIYEINTETRKIRMRRSTGKLTWGLGVDALIDVHDRIHAGQLDLGPYEIDRIKPTWGNYIAALLKHLGCRKAVLPMEETESAIKP